MAIANEVSQETFNKINALSDRILALSEDIKAAATLGRKVELSRERGALFAERQALMGH